MRHLFTTLLLLFSAMGLPVWAQPGDSAFLQIPVLPGPVAEEISLPQSLVLSVPDLPLAGQDGWFSPEKLGGGVNWFRPPERIGADQARYMLNLLPWGDVAYTRREGYRKIYFNSKGAVYNMGVIDSAGEKSRLVVAAGDSLWYAGPGAGWELTSLSGIVGEGSYMTSTPPGIIITNQDDTARIWGGEDTSAAGVRPLGVCDTGTVSVSFDVTGDTVWIVDSGRHWLADYWIGYFVHLPSAPDSYFAIIDNGPDSLLVIGDSTSYNRAGDAFWIVSRPDSVGGSLGFPRGPAAAYYDQRLFVASAYSPYRIWYSHKRLINDIDIDAFIDLSMDADDQTMAMVVFNNWLLLFGSHSLFGMGPDLVAYPISKSVGCPAPKTIARGEGYIYFLSNRNTISRISPNAYGSLSYEPEKISDAIDRILQNIDPSYLADCAGVYTDQQYWFSYSPDSCVVWDERTEQWYPQSFGFNQALVMPPLMGDLWSEELFPNSDLLTQWSRYPASGGHYDKVDDKNTADYIHTLTNGSKDRFGFSDPVGWLHGAPVSGMKFYVLAKVGAAGYYPQANFYLYSGTTDYFIGSIYPSSGWNTYTLLAPNNPSTGAAWNYLAIKDMVLTVEYQGNASGMWLYIAGIWVEPQYIGEFSVGSFFFAGPTKDFIYKYGGTFDDDTSSAFGEVYGRPVTAIYRSGWLSGGSPIGQYAGAKFYLQKMIDGTATTYLYKDFDAAPTETLTVSASAETTYVNWLASDLRGNVFSVGVESSADTVQLKGWGLQVQTIGER